ncbi:MAG: hypothetical protein WAR83_12915 [Flavobacteriales bacterium]
MSSSTSSSKNGSMGYVRFLLRVLWFVLVLAICGVLLMWLLPNAQQSNYFDALIDKHARLDSIASPKVIVIGGSSATFGINSEQLEANLCRPVVNLSLHAALGFGFARREIHGKISKNDLVMVCLEQATITDPDPDNYELASAFTRYPKSLSYMRYDQWPKVFLSAVVLRLRASWALFMDPGRAMKYEPIYRADAVNAYGDMVGYDVLPVIDTLPLEHMRFESPSIGPEFRPLMDDLGSEAKRVGANVVFVWPAIARSSYNAPRDEALFRELQEMNITLVGKPDQCVYPDSAFLDTPYHLKLWGRNARTEKLVSDLCGISLVTCCSSEPDPGSTE